MPEPSAIPVSQQPWSISSLQEQSDSSLQEQSDSSLQEQSDSSLQEQLDSSLQEQSDSSLQEQSDSSLQEQSDSRLQEQSDSSLQEQSDRSAGEGGAEGDTSGGGSTEEAQSLQHKQILKAAKTFLRQQDRTGLEPQSTDKSQPPQVSLAPMSPLPVHHLLTPSQMQLLIQQQQAMMLHQQHIKDFYKQQQQQIYLQLLQQKNPEKRVTEPSLQQLLLQHLLQLQQQQLGHLLLPSHALAPGESRGTSPDCTNSTTPPPSTPSTASVNLAQEKSQPPRRTECVADVDRSATQRLYSHGVCNWPGCECVCENIGQFVRHLGNEHPLDARSTAQCRVQMQVVQQLDLQLSKERERLQAMMAHLHLPPEPQTPSSCHQLNSVSSVSMLRSQLPPSSPELPQESPPPAAAPGSPLSLGPGGPYPPYPATTPSAGALRHHSKQHPSLLPLSSDTGQTFELYENADIRPPYTYATLIRQAIVEAPDLQLTLSEVYSWFTRTFAYFRRNAATWKNAVRHNLSLHKCFVRVENVKGAVWTVDEEEYLRRRSQKISGSSVGKHLALSLPYGATVTARVQTALAEAAAAGSRRGDPGTRRGDPGTRRGDPGTRRGDPGTRRGDPGVRRGDPGVRRGDPGVRRGDPGCISSSCQEPQDSDPPSRPDSPRHAQRPIMEDQECLSVVTTTNHSPEPQQDAELEEGQLSDLD